MEHSQHSTNPRTDAALSRELYQAYLEELAAITSYSYYRIITQKDLPAAAALFAEISMDEMHHFLHLGELLLSRGVSPAVDVRLRDTPIRILCDRDSHVPVITRRLLTANVAEERKAAANYRRLAERIGAGPNQKMLLEMAAEEEGHADAQEALARRLGAS